MKTLKIKNGVGSRARSTKILWGGVEGGWGGDGISFGPYQFHCMEVGYIFMIRVDKKGDVKYEDMEFSPPYLVVSEPVEIKSPPSPEYEVEVIEAKLHIHEGDQQ